jgi:prevent-host-death family protein
MTSRAFNNDTGGAKRAAERGPVYITDRGRPSHVLLSYADYVHLAGSHPTMIELLGSPPGIEDVEFDAPRRREHAAPAAID